MESQCTTILENTMITAELHYASSLKYVSECVSASNWWHFSFCVYVYIKQIHIVFILYILLGCNAAYDGHSGFFTTSPNSENCVHGRYDRSTTCFCCKFFKCSTPDWEKNHCSNYLTYLVLCAHLHFPTWCFIHPDSKMLLNHFLNTTIHHVNLNKNNWTNVVK